MMPILSTEVGGAMELRGLFEKHEWRAGADHVPDYCNLPLSQPLIHGQGDSHTAKIVETIIFLLFIIC